MMLRKLGLTPIDPEGDEALVEELEESLAKAEVD